MSHLAIAMLLVWMPGRRCSEEQREEGELLRCAAGVMESYKEEEGTHACINSPELLAGFAFVSIF